MNVITLEVRTVYGVDKFYPACPTSQRFADLLKQTTLTKSDIKQIEDIGFGVKYTHRFTSEQRFI